MSQIHLLTPIEWKAALAIKLGEYVQDFCQPVDWATWRASEVAPYDFVILHAGTVSILDILRFFWAGPSVPGVATAVVGDAARQYEWVLREAGAVEVLGRTWHAGRLASVIRNHFARAPIQPSEQSLVNFLQVRSSN